MSDIFNTAYYWTEDDNDRQFLFPSYSPEFAFKIYHFEVIKLHSGRASSNNYVIFLLFKTKILKIT